MLRGPQTPGEFKGASAYTRSPTCQRSRRRSSGLLSAGMLGGSNAGRDRRRSATSRRSDGGRAVARSRVRAPGQRLRATRRRRRRASRARTAGSPPDRPGSRSKIASPASRRRSPRFGPRSSGCALRATRPDAPGVRRGGRPRKRRSAQRSTQSRAAAKAGRAEAAPSTSDAEDLRPPVGIDAAQCDQPDECVDELHFGLLDRLRSRVPDDGGGERLGCVRLDTLASCGRPRWATTGTSRRGVSEGSDAVGRSIAAAPLPPRAFQGEPASASWVLALSRLTWALARGAAFSSFLQPELSQGRVLTRFPDRPPELELLASRPSTKAHRGSRARG